MNRPADDVLAIINPNAGRQGATALAARLCATLRQAGVPVQEVLTGGMGDARRIAAERAASHSLVVACGGDGTLSEVISGLMQVDDPPDVGFLPIGSTCDVARNFKLSSKPEKAAHELLEGISYPLDIGLVGGAEAVLRTDLPAGVVPASAHELPRHFSYITSFGAFTEAAYATRRRLKKTLGHFAYVLRGFQTIGQLSPIEAEVTLDGLDYSGRYLFGGVINSFSVGGLVKLNDVLLNDGLFEVLLVKPPRNLSQAARLVSRLLRRRTDDTMIRERAREIRFRFSEPVSFTVDGEYGGTRSDWQISNLRQAVRLRVKEAPGHRL